MGINFKDFLKFVTPKQKSDILRLLIDYKNLKNKLENTEDNSWYFKQALESNKSKLVSLRKDYEKIRIVFNESTIDTFIEKINKNLEFKSAYEKNGMNMIQQIHYSSIISENEFYKELIRLKSKTESLKDIDYYLENPKDFLKFLD